MFRRRTDFSWPLILILIGLFFLSLRLPRQWEQIARPTALSLTSHTQPPTEELTSVPGNRPEVGRLDIFRSIKPAGSIGSNAEAMLHDTASANYETRSPVVVAAVDPRVPAPEIVPAAAPLAEPLKVAVSSEGSRDSQNDTAALPVPIPAGQSVLPSPQLKASDVGPAASESTEQVRVLRDVSTPETGPSLGPDNKPMPEIANRRLPPESIAAEDKPSVLPTEGLETSRQPQPAAVVPEPSATGDASSAVAERLPGPAHTVVPEPQMPAVENYASTGPQSTVPEPNSIATADGPQQVETAKPAAKVEAAVPPASEAAASEPPMKAIGRAWEEPKFLLVQLDELRKHEVTQGWAIETSKAITALGPAISVGAPQTTEILRHLEQLTRAAPALATKVNDASLADNLARTSSALERRITVWKQIGQMGGMEAANAPAPAVDPQSFSQCLNEIDRLTNNSSEGHAWRQYLLIESLHDWVARRRNGDERLPGDLAQQVLKRYNQVSVTSHQRQFLTSGPMAALHREMLRHTAEPVESSRLLQHLENYERSGLPSDARLLAQDCQYLAVGTAAAQRELGERIEMHYRNANLRLAVSETLLNRMIPKRKPEYAAVQDTIQGAEVRGQSLMANDVAVRMIPDTQHVRLALEVNGEVAALTRSTAGPATFFSDSESTYVARKPLEISLRGIHAGLTEVSVDNSSQLREVRTDFDGVPIFGRVARNVARSEHDQRMPAADAEVREKIAAKAKERVDHETTEQIAAAARRLQDELLGPMDSLLLDPTMIAAETTAKRFSMRIRLAGPDQLGGHTPRPQAPADSLASVQIHESMLNNVLERLELDGHTFDLAGLGQRLAERLHGFQLKPVDPDQEDVKITFAAKDAVHVRCNDGRLEITLAIARLSKGTRKWKDFQVRAFYRPTVQGRRVDLAREGIVQLIGPRLNAGAQLALRGVFLKVFSQKEAIHATPESFVKNPKLDGVIVTQFVIDDGWIGAAIGPRPVATAQAASATR